MKIILVRHGQTDQNTKEIIQAPDVSLDEKGRAQAEQVAEKLRSEEISIAYVSNFKRAADTADIILKFHPHTKVVFTPALQEKDTGVFVGRAHADQKKAREVSGLTFYEFRPEGGESLVDLQKRVIEFYEQVIREHQSETILVVTHNGAIKTLLLHLTGKTLAEWSTINVPNTAVTVIDADSDGRHTIKLSNDTDHLAGE